MKINDGGYIQGIYNSDGDFIVNKTGDTQVSCSKTLSKSA